MTRALALVVCLSLSLPASAQPADAPVVVCPPGLVCLTPDVAVATAKRLASAEAKVEVYEKATILPWWAGIIVGFIAVGVGVAITTPIVVAHCHDKGC